MKKLCFAVMAMCMLLSCGGKNEKGAATEEATLSGLMKSDFVSEVDGKPTALYVLKNKKGAEACVTNWGGRLVSVMVPDKNGKMTDVVLGYDNIAQYVANPDMNYGALIGRYGNRIANGKFTLDGTEYQLPQNNNGHCLHGGPKGYHAVVWDAKQIDDQTLELTYLSKDGEAGFPGNLDIKVIYKLTDDNAIDIQYEAETDKPTIVNMTNHSYFNLDGDPTTDNSAYLLTLNADNYTPVDSTFMTTGEIATVEGTPMDFRKPTAIGANINQEFEQLKNGNGIDHNWVLNTQGDVTKVCATLESPKTGIVLDVYTNEPGIQVYCGNFLDGTLTGKKGIVYNFRAAVCLETDKYPDTPNKPEWPSAVLRPGEKYQSQCIYKFSVHK